MRGTDSGVEHLEDKERRWRFASAYEAGKGRLAVAVEAAVAGEASWDARLSAGLRAALDFLAASPALARLLLVEAAAAGPARLEHERSLAQLLRSPPCGPEGGEAVSAETARLLAGGLVSHLCGRVLAGEAESLGESHDLLLDYLLAAALPATAAERRAALA